MYDEQTSLSTFWPDERAWFRWQHTQETEHSDYTADTCRHTATPKTSDFQAENTCPATEIHPETSDIHEIHEIHPETSVGPKSRPYKEAAPYEALHQWAVQAADRQSGGYAGAGILHEQEHGR